MDTNCAPLVADCFCFVMRETSYCLCQTIIKLTLLKLLTLPPDIYMPYLILIIIILNKWYTTAHLFVLVEFALKTH